MAVENALHNKPPLKYIGVFTTKSQRSFPFFFTFERKIQLPPVDFIARRCWKNSVLLLWLFRENCNFENFLQFLLRRANIIYLSKQMN